MREPYMKYTITKLGEDNESADSILGNYLTECKLIHHTSIKASSMTDTQLELLQIPQDVRNDCRIVDMCSVSKTTQLDHG